MNNGNLYPIPGYEGLYWVDVKGGGIFNKSHHCMRTTQTNKGKVVELRKYGQREKLLVEDLITKALEEKQ